MKLFYKKSCKYVCKYGKLLIDKTYKLIPLTIAALIMYNEWRNSFNPFSSIGHFAHLGGGIFAGCYMLYLKGYYNKYKANA